MPERCLCQFDAQRLHLKDSAEQVRKCTHSVAILGGMPLLSVSKKAITTTLVQLQTELRQTFVWYTWQSGESSAHSAGRCRRFYQNFTKLKSLRLCSSHGGEMHRRTDFCVNFPYRIVGTGVSTVRPLSAPLISSVNNIATQTRRLMHRQQYSILCNDAILQRHEQGVSCSHQVTLLTSVSAPAPQHIPN